MKDGFKSIGRWAAKWGANAAGVLWTSGNLVQAAGALAALSGIAALASGVNMAASGSSALFGRRPWGLPLTCSLAIGGISLTLREGILALDPKTLAGWLLFCGAMVLGGASGHLIRKFSASKNAAARLLLGNARMTAWGICLASRMPVIAGALLAPQVDLVTAGMFILYACGDMCAMASKPDGAEESASPTADRAAK